MGTVWHGACTIGDLGQNMADWLEGRVPSWPGYLADEFGDEETDGARHLVPTMVALNRAGFVTTGSQPGETGGGYRQRAWVEGVVHDHNPLLGRLLGLHGQGLTVIRGWPEKQHVLTEGNGRPYTTVGGWRWRRDYIHSNWRGIGHRALRELRQHGAVINIYDPVWGRDDRLWPALDALTTAATR
ncbi:hypothetical protein GCM10010275_30200 [Streptomyces litmocidini]|uniref:DUF6919 domain-containing protein n=1 Tax=Streptomyces litmocidini TaxID=67318 RepID=UPI00167E5660|nr:hypothetical protein [Streptomyces litmocidini]GGU91099.1 hypothetical protein GCM10010275_30200 [Streptomyces litmocidini]